MDSSNPVDSSNPTDDNTPTDDRPVVTLSLDCSPAQITASTCNKTTAGVIEIKNTMRSDYLPVYVVSRDTAEDTALRVTLSWASASSEGSRGSDMIYDEYPKLSPVFAKFKSLKGGRGPYLFNKVNTLVTTPVTSVKDVGTTGSPLGNCDKIKFFHNKVGGIGGQFFEATFFSFKFLNGVNGFDVMTEKNGKIKVEIPAGSNKVSFRLDPHRCPDSTTGTNTKKELTEDKKKNKHNTVSYTINVGIKSDSTSAYTSDETSKDLKVKFLMEDSMGGVVGNMVESTLNGDTFKTAIEDRFLSRHGSGTGNINTDTGRQKRLQWTAANFLVANPPVANPPMSYTGATPPVLPLTAQELMTLKGILTTPERVALKTAEDNSLANKDAKLWGENLNDEEDIETKVVNAVVGELITEITKDHTIVNRNSDSRLYHKLVDEVSGRYGSDD